MEKKKTHSESLTHFSYNQKSLRIRRKKSGLLYSRWYRNPISKNCSPNNNTGREDFLITKMTTIIILLGLGCPIQSLVLTLMKLQAHLGSSHIIRSIPQHMWRRSSLGRRRLGTAAGDPPTDWLVGKKKKRPEILTDLSSRWTWTSYKLQFCLLFLLKFTSWVFYSFLSSSLCSTFVVVLVFFSDSEMTDERFWMIKLNP